MEHKQIKKLSHHKRNITSSRISPQTYCTTKRNNQKHNQKVHTQTTYSSQSNLYTPNNCKSSNKEQSKNMSKAKMLRSNILTYLNKCKSQLQESMSLTHTKSIQHIRYSLQKVPKEFKSIELSVLLQKTGSLLNLYKQKVNKYKQKVNELNKQKKFLQKQLQKKKNKVHQLQKQVFKKSKSVYHK